MWLEWVALVLCVYIYGLLLTNSEKGKKLLDSDGSDTGNVSGSSSIIPTIWGLQVFKIALCMITVNRNVPNYEWSAKSAKIYGSVHAFKLPFLRERILNCNNLELAKKIMNCSGWTDRLYKNHCIYTTSFNKPIGLLFGNGEHWKQARRLTLKLLHQLEFFKAAKMEAFMAPEIGEVVSRLGEEVDRQGGLYYCSPHQMFEIATLNVVCQVIMERRFDHCDPRINRILGVMNKANREFSALYSILEVVRFLKHFPKLTFLASGQQCSNEFYDFFREVINERKAKGTYKEHPVDLIDGFLQELEKQSKGDATTVLTEDDLLVTLRDMVLAGADTTNSALEHGMLHISLQPHIQRRVQAEIDDVIGSNRLPTYEDQKRMLYTQAVLLEILRIASPVPCTARCTMEDTYIGSTMIPKGSTFAINVFGIHRSEQLWEDGDAFRPDRFLNADQKTLVNVEKIIPFGYGKRLCIGESVARVTLFIFFTTLLQKFSFEISDAHPAPSFRNLLGLSRCPIPYHVKCRRRLPEAS